MIINNLQENIFIAKVDKNGFNIVLQEILYCKFISISDKYYFSDNAFELLPEHSIITSLLRWEP